MNKSRSVYQKYFCPALSTIVATTSFRWASFVSGWARTRKSSVWTFWLESMETKSFSTKMAVLEVLSQEMLELQRMVRKKTLLSLVLLSRPSRQSLLKVLVVLSLRGSRKSLSWRKERLQSSTTVLASKKFGKFPRATLTSKKVS